MIVDGLLSNVFVEILSNSLSTGTSALRYRVLSGICAPTVAFRRVLARQTRERNPILCGRFGNAWEIWRENYSAT